ncbi:hypothetical protein ACFYTQ_27730 [Nocardia sp. NPDC004068]|uniref:hypothetical protein n=1 Tax=Nocardia sp. NPDC004068 TaxID=3364303 RepID=UPI0036AA9404
MAGHSYEPGCPCSSCKRGWQPPHQRRQSQPKKKPRKTGNFESKQKDGTTLYGPRETEGRPGHKHGHRGENFNRSPHSTIGSAALGDAHNSDEHKHDRTHRW